MDVPLSRRNERGTDTEKATSSKGLEEEAGR